MNFPDFNQYKAYIKPAFGFAFFVFALIACHHILIEVHPSAIRAAMREISPAAILAAFAATSLSFLMLVGYEYSADQYAGAKLPLKTLALGSFCSFAVSNAIGLTIFSGGTVRYRLYGRHGLGGMAIAKITLFSSGAFMLVLPLLAALPVLCDHREVAAVLAMPEALLLTLAALPVLVYIAVAAYFYRRRLPEGTKYTWFSRMGRYRVELPRFSLALRQFLITAMDIIATATTLYVLLPQPPDYTLFLLIYFIAIAAGVISNVPGGLGVFETVILAAFADTIDAASLAAALVLYRLIYYVIPLLIACVLLLANEVRSGKEKYGKLVRATSTFAPPVMALLVFISGFLLILSGSTPAVYERLRFLGVWLPAGLIDTFHLVAAVIGVFCLLLAKGLYQRLSGARLLTSVLLVLGGIFALLKELDWETAAILFLIAGLLSVFRDAFYRKSRLSQLTYSPYYLWTVCGVLVIAGWLVFFSYKNVRYAEGIWWHFGLDANVSRSLRALLACSVVALYAGVRWLLRSSFHGSLPTREELAEAETIYRSTENPDDALALNGDKMLLFNANRDAFIMYGRYRRSLIALYDPVGPREKQPELIWQFRELCDRSLYKPVFYQVDGENLSMYMDIGLAAFKIGEEAIVELEPFEIETSKRKELRHEYNRGVKEGLSFEVFERGEAPMAELKRISDQWLASKNVREKGFSLGRFDEDYLRRFRIAVLRQQGKIIAFSNLFEPEGHRRVSADLMRYSDDAPKSTMTFLFLSMMLYFKEREVKEFSLGMVPLSGIKPYKTAPLAQRIAALLYRKGEYFYNFQGLRHFKEKFGPRWESRYIAIPRDGNLFPALADVSILIAGGVAGMIKK